MMIELMPPELMLAYFLAIGACLGSFVNVVIVRWPENESIIKPRSRCPGCRQPIAWYDNIPLISFMVLRARCRHCGTSIAWRYPLIELLMAMLSGAVWLRFGLAWDLLLWVPLCAALLAITFIDIDHWYVPDLVTFPSMALALGFSFVPAGLSPQGALLGLIPAASLWALAWVFEKITGKEGMGLGDVKLLALIGLAMGLQGAFNVLVLASFQGSFVGIFVALTGGHHGVQDDAPADNLQDEDEDEDDWVPTRRHIPFGPFLALGCLQAVLLPDLFGDAVQRLIASLFEYLS